MFNKKKQTDTATETVIGEGVLIETAKLSGDGSVRIDGQLIGEIELDGNLILGEKGIVNGDIKVKYALIAGKVEGNIYCNTTLHITGTASINGTVEAKGLVVDEGAVFNGSCHMGAETIELSKHMGYEAETVN